MMAAARKIPVVVVLGATGTGKSKLAIELGRLFNGEIISADSMQMYSGLDIITNKVTGEEQAQCPHHLLSVLSPLSMNNTVVDFRNMALPIVEKLLQENKMPIIVGGTNYYIESLLWDFLIDEQTVDLANNLTPDVKQKEESGIDQKEQHTTLTGANRDAIPDSPDSRKQSEGFPDILAAVDSASGDSDGDKANAQTGSEKCSTAEAESLCGNVDGISTKKSEAGHAQSSTARREKEGKYAAFDSKQLYQLLQTVDPETAKCLHPKNRRKVVRALQVHDSYGVGMSKIHRAQHASGNSVGLSGALRYPHCCVFWIQSQKSVLDERLDGRVDAMLKRGLVAELHALHSHYLTSVAQQHGKPDYTLGIFQSIGFKEFHKYLVLPPESRETPEGKALFQEGVQGLKLATRQYARKQLKWIKNRFVKRPGDHVPNVYSLDSTDPTVWAQKVLQPAVDVVSAVCQGREVPVSPLRADPEAATVHVHNVCEVCGGRVFTTLEQWQVHLGSRRHQKVLQSKRRRAKAAEEDREPSDSKRNKLTD